MAEEGETRAGELALKDLKRKTARGALVSTLAQVGTFVLRTGSLMVLARLLLKEDFGLVNMVTAFIGFLALLRDGLSAGTIQRASFSSEQASVFFWINLAAGALLALLSAAAAPVLVAFFDEPRLLSMTLVLAISLLFNGAAAQHRALLQREMRFGALAASDLAGRLASVLVGIGMAMAGFGYWSLVWMTVAQPVVSAMAVWLARGGFRDGPITAGNSVDAGVRGRRDDGQPAVTSRSTSTRCWLGASEDAAELGLYGRAYQLVSLPNDTLYSTIGIVAFPRFRVCRTTLPPPGTCFLKRLQPRALWPFRYRRLCAVRR